MKISELLKYYNQDDILNEIVRVSKNREVVAKFEKGFFQTRPSTILYTKDVLDLIRQGAVSFHMSVERWRNPFSLNQTNSKKEMDDLRIGWDLILDIDTSVLDYAKICAKLLCIALDFHNITNYSIKYSGGNGFHIAVPYESFPETINGKYTKDLFPIAAQRIAEYLSFMIKDKLAQSILSINSIEEISKKTKKPIEELIIDGKFNPYSVIEIDTIAISPRHLIRMPYSVNEKKGNISVPLLKKDIEDFEPSSSRLKNSKFTYHFIDGSKSVKGEAEELFVSAFDWHNKRLKKIEEAKLRKNSQNPQMNTMTFSKNTYKIPADEFPPCIKKILLGMDDGKKRALFILLNYFKSANYSFKEIENLILEWNKKNKEPLRESYIKSQINWHKKKNESYLPPNCDSLMYYTDISVCEKDEICEKIKNPINYSFFIHRKKKKII